MMRSLWLGTLGMLSVAWLAGAAEEKAAAGIPTSPTATGFLDKAATAGDTTVRYALYVPDNYTPDRPWPLIVFLHGAGERGNDNLLQTTVGLGRVIRGHRDWFPALVLMPQCPDGEFWDAVLPAVEGAIAQTVADYNVDKKAITLTGLSLGGYATWTWGATMTDTFAALMPVCGGGDLTDLGPRFTVADPAVYGSIEERLPRLATVPIWAFHGADDTVVLPEKSEAMVERVKAAGGNVQYTRFEDTGHNSWDATYGNKAHIDWLLQQRKE